MGPGGRNAVRPGAGVGRRGGVAAAGLIEVQVHGREEGGDGLALVEVAIDKVRHFGAEVRLQQLEGAVIRGLLGSGTRWWRGRA